MTTGRNDNLFLSPQDVIGIIGHHGMAATLQGMAAYIHQDFLRWQSFDKAPRVASHSADGVIELMPIADASTYTFKYVNGHPTNTAKGLPTVMAFGVLGLRSHRQADAQPAKQSRCRWPADGCLQQHPGGSAWGRHRDHHHR